MSGMISWPVFKVVAAHTCYFSSRREDIVAVVVVVSQSSAPASLSGALEITETTL